MAKDKKEDDREGMIIGGGVLIGLGVGFFLLENSPLFFVGSLMIGIGFGLFASQWIPKK